MSAERKADSTTRILQNTITVIDTVGEAFRPFIPLIYVVSLLANEIVEIYKNAKYNKKMCDVFLDRIDAVQASINYLQRRKEKNERLFRKEAYYRSFVKFTDVLKRVKKFLEAITQLQGFSKLWRVNTIKENFEILTSEFDEVMKDLQFSTIVSAEEQREIDQETLREEIADMKKFMAEIKGGIIVNSNKQINTIFQEISILKNRLDSIENKTATSIYEIPIEAIQLPESELNDPVVTKKTDRRRPKPPYIFKKVLKDKMLEVACKPVKIPVSETLERKKLQARLLIMRKLKDSPNILKFYGISTLEGNRIMVFEWAELGSLKELYENKDISWRAKASIALNICRGLIFVHSCHILHHDIRCKNILMTRPDEPKIANFDYARTTDSHTSEMDNLTTVVHWMSPEKLQSIKDKKKDSKKELQAYNFKCEIFSFGMLLWELAFEKIPYEKWNMDEIIEYVTSGKRENIRFGKTDWCEIAKIQEGYAKIIKGAWEDDPMLRESLQKIFLQLNDLASTYQVGEEKILYPKGSLTRGFTPMSVSDEGGLELTSSIPYAFTEIISLEEGIKAHGSGNRKKAWTCFQVHASLGDPNAVYWKGYYLLKGYGGVKDEKEARKLLKAAADEGIIDSQLRYALTMPENEKNFKNYEFVKYLTMAAENDHPTAQFNLGNAYVNGKIEATIDVDNVDRGIKLLKLAALKNQSMALDLLKKMDINLYS